MRGAPGPAATNHAGAAAATPLHGAADVEQPADHRPHPAQGPAPALVPAVRQRTLGQLTHQPLPLDGREVLHRHRSHRAQRLEPPHVSCDATSPPDAHPPATPPPPRSSHPGRTGHRPPAGCAPAPAAREASSHHPAHTSSTRHTATIKKRHGASSTRQHEFNLCNSSIRTLRTAHWPTSAQAGRTGAQGSRSCPNSLTCVPCREFEPSMTAASRTSIRTSAASRGDVTPGACS